MENYLVNNARNNLKDSGKRDYGDRVKYFSSKIKKNTKEDKDNDFGNHIDVQDLK